jgi:8-demethyl-8-alpha-L-rhamnosyltetracenomycin-C 2'-O-methyltransferase
MGYKKTLTEIFAEFGHFGSDIGCNDKGSNHNYLKDYDKLFKPYQNGGSILEIGLAMGDSIKLWDRYFENATIVGADISVVFTLGEYKNRVVVIQCDATKKGFLEPIKDFTFDIIVDDGSHMEADQIATFELLKHKMNPGGIYIIEDILAIEQNKSRFEALHDNCEVYDFRSISGTFADVFILYRF